MNVQQRISFTEIVRELDYKKLLKPGTVIITDFDNSLISYAEEAKNLLSLQPEKIPDKVLTQIHKVVESGARLAIATNRPQEGFELAGAFAKVMGNYPVFPGSLIDQGVEVFGGGRLFMVEKFKRTDNAFYALKSWLLANEKEGGAGITNSSDIAIVCIGDRPTDMRFFEKLQDIIDNDYPLVQFLVYKLPGLEAEDTAKQDLWNRLIRFLMKYVP